MGQLVSILIPCFNAERWISEAIQSCLGQTYQLIEVIVIDDGSTDGSLKIIKSFGDRIQWETGPNRGGNVARNRLLELARGEWLQYLDADDYLLPDKIAKQMDFLNANPAADVIYSPVTKEHWSDEAVRREWQPIPEPHDPWVLLARWYLPQTGAPLWRKQAIVDAGGWKDEQPCCQEHELYLRLLMAGKRFVHCHHRGAIYREWGENTVSKRDTSAVNRQRLQIETRAEDFLRARAELTPERLGAINQARFEMARVVWLQDAQRALEIIEAIKCSQPDFVPAANVAPWLYQMIYNTFGFRAAEKVADWKRNWFGGSSPSFLR